MRIRVKNYSILILLPVILFLFQPSLLYAQRKSNVFYSGDRLEVKMGSGLMFDVIPLGLSGGKTIHVPAGEFALGAGLNYKHFFTPRFAIGYQFDFSRFSGRVYEDERELTRTGANAFGNSFTMGYYLRSTVQENYRFNYHVYYKLGAIALRLANGAIETEGAPPQAISISDVGIGLLTGLGLGVNYIFNQQLSIVWTIDYNHIQSSTTNLLRLDRTFSNTSATVSHYAISTIGVNYRFRHKKKIQLRDNLPFFE